MNDDTRDFFSRPRRYLADGSQVALRARLVEDLLRPLGPSEVLDLGCGDGGVSQRLATRHRLTLVDGSREMVRLAQKRFAAVAGDSAPRIVQGELDQLQDSGELGGETFDVVLCLGLLAHVGDLSSALAEVDRLSGEAAHWLLQWTDHGTWSGRAAFRWHHRRSRRRLQPVRREWIEEITGRLGFRCVDERRLLPMLPGLGKLPSPVVTGIRLAAGRLPRQVSGDVFRLYRRDRRDRRPR